MSRKIVISGASGLIGRELTGKLIELGYSVVCLSRNPQKAAKVLPASVEIIEWLGEDDDNEKKMICSQINGAGCVINLAGENIGGLRWSKKKKKAILQSRLSAVKTLYEAIKICKAKPPLYIGASAVGFYGDTGEQRVNESNNAGKDFLAGVVEKWEESQAKISLFVDRIAFLRIGMVLSNNGGAFPLLLLPYRLFLGGKIGSGKQWVSWIHIEDLVRAIIEIINNPQIQGTVNIVSPEPVRMDELNIILSKALKRPGLFGLPGFLPKLLMGEAASLLLNSSRVEPMILNSVGFKFNFKYFNKAVEDLLKSKE